MTRSQAIEAIENGYSITHHLFTDMEYVRYNNGVMEDESGNYIIKGEFWEYRSVNEWTTGWEIY